MPPVPFPYPNGTLVREASSPQVFVIWGRARLPVPDAEFEPMGYKWEKVKVVADGALKSVTRKPTTGTLLRERSSEDVSLMQGGRRWLLRSTYTVEALGYRPALIRTVPNGCLAHIVVEAWDSLSKTPGSAVCLPYGTVFYPLRVPGTRVRTIWGQEVRTIELRGWLTHVDEFCNAADPDWGYSLLPDVGYAHQAGLDLTSIIKLGNILEGGDSQPDSTNRAWLAEPHVKLEVSGWPPKGQKSRRRPPDWSGPAPGSCDDAPDSLWPFDCRNPRPTDPPLRAGQYVRVVGSLITDKPHRNDAHGYHWLEGVWFGNSNHEDEPTRHTEVHPPDTIEVLAEDRRRTETLRGVVVAAPGVVTGFPAEVSVLDVEIPAPPRPTGDVTLEVEEFVRASETDFSTIVEGNADRTGARLTKLEDRVRVFVRVRGKKSVVGGSAGKFVALYRVYWSARVLPFGSLDSASPGRGVVRVVGWAIDPDTSGPIDVHAYLDGAFAGAATANLPRPDVGAAHRGFGDAHGFDFAVTAGSGHHRVCVYAINVGAGDQNPELGCRDVTIGTPADCRPIADAIRSIEATVKRLQAELNDAPPSEKPAILAAIRDARRSLEEKKAELEECIRGQT